MNTRMIMKQGKDVGCFRANVNVIRKALATIPKERLEQEAEWARDVLGKYNSVESKTVREKEQAKRVYWSKYHADLKARGANIATERRVSAVRDHIQNVVSLHRLAGKGCGKKDIIKCNIQGNVDGKKCDRYYLELLTQAEKRVPYGAPEEKELLRLCVYFIEDGKKVSNKLMAVVIKEYAKTFSKVEPESHEIEMF